jgi:preprotein translocase subunit SecG
MQCSGAASAGRPTAAFERILASMQHVIIVIHLMLVLALIGVVLLQRSEGGGLGIGSGGGGGFMTSRGTANVLTRATAILAGLFFVTSLILSILAGMNRAPTSILQGGSAAPAVPTAPGSAPPLGGGQGGLLNQLQGGPPAAPGAPAAPSGPQVPQSQ